jgi:hypothetical protein
VKKSPDAVLRSIRKQLRDEIAARTKAESERDDARCDFQSAAYDCARLITAIRDDAWIHDVEELRALAQDCADSGRDGWVAVALKHGSEVEGLRERLERERDDARKETERLRSDLHMAEAAMLPTVSAENAQLRAEHGRLHEKVGFWERSNVAALARQHGLPTPASEEP